MECAFLFAGILFHKDAEKTVSERLSKEFGTIALESEVLAFDFTEYYKKEMGEGLLRKWLLFDTKIEQQFIADIKLKTIGIEDEFKMNGKRRVNIDPGYVTLSKVVLPTTKDCAHRIYLKDGIYAEITLIYRKGTWQPNSWTYRDYCTETALEFFNEARQYIVRKREA